ncbi:MAG TPA: hypothetical protein PK313_16325, partial [Myxococcota bacterium]|nr:hypothetical protein [Myxococcota bacterium]
RAFVDALPPAGPVRPALFVVATVLGSERTRDLDANTLDALATAISGRGGTRAYVAVPERVDEAGPVTDPADRNAIVAGLPALAASLAAAGLAASLVPNARAPADPGSVLLASRAAAVLPAASWDPAFLEHRFAGPAFGWAMWSYPVWVREFPPEDAPGVTP